MHMYGHAGAIVGLLSVPLHFPVFCVRTFRSWTVRAAGSQRYQQKIFGVPDGQ